MKHALLLTVLTVAALAHGAFAADRPNIIVIFTDDHGYSGSSGGSVG